MLQRNLQKFCWSIHVIKLASMLIFHVKIYFNSTGTVSWQQFEVTSCSGKQWPSLKIGRGRPLLVSIIAYNQKDKSNLI